MGGSKTAETGNDEAKRLGPENFDYAIPSSQAVWKTVKKDDRWAIGQTVLLVFDID
jgi:hypothetical protein